MPAQYTNTTKSFLGEALASVSERLPVVRCRKRIEDELSLPLLVILRCSNRPQKMPDKCFAHGRVLDVQFSLSLSEPAS